MTYTISTCWHKAGFHVTATDNIRGTRYFHHEEFSMKNKAEKLADEVKNHIRTNPNWQPKMKYWEPDYNSHLSYTPSSSIYDDDDDWSDDEYPIICDENEEEEWDAHCFEDEESEYELTDLESDDIIID